MFQIQTLNKISPVGLAQLSDNYQIADTVENPDAILVRSAVMHEMEFGSNLLAIARAGAGVNNIPLDRAAEEGIVVSIHRVQTQTVLRSWHLQVCCLLPVISLAVSTGYRP